MIMKLVSSQMKSCALWACAANEKTFQTHRMMNVVPFVLFRTIRGWVGGSAGEEQHKCGYILGCPETNK